MSALDGPFRRAWKGVWAARLIAGARALVDLVLPLASEDGGEAVSGRGLTSKSWSRIRFLEDPVCDGCGMPFAFDGGSYGPERCTACIARPHSFSRARAACLYDDYSRDLILGLKHADELQNALVFARWISRAAEPLLADADAVVPVPLHRWKLLRRRFNQSAEIARPLARARGLDYLPDVLVRVRNTGSQGGKSARGRRMNVKDAFRVNRRGAVKLKGRHIILIDDVLTTGATADACARALLAAGARQVDLAVIAGVHGAREMPK